jgi:hypothetical protein
MALFPYPPLRDEPQPLALERQPTETDKAFWLMLHGNGSDYCEGVLD